MGKITYGSLVTEIRGSVGGQTFQKNAYGYSIKNKPSMSRLQSEAQNAQHRRLNYIVKGWQQITQAQRDAWEAWAIAHPIPSKFNPSSYLSGYNYFLKYNLQRCMFVDTYLAEPNLGTVNLYPFTPTLFNNAGALLFNPAPSVDNTNVFMNLYMSPPQPQSRGFSNSPTRALIALDARVQAFDLTSFYTGIFGFVPPVGSFIFTELQLWGSSIPYIFGSEKFILNVQTP